MFRVRLHLPCGSILIAALLSGWTTGAGGASFQITEFLAVNDNSIHDEDGEASDWIEVHNPGTAVEFLDGWFLTDDPNDPAKWRFPEGVEMQPNGYRVVFASGKNRTNALGRLHTNFKLASEGEYLALVDPLGNVISQFAPTNQFGDVSYGRDVGDITLLVYYQKPTPGERNAMGGAGFAPDVIFSRNSGTFSVQEPFLLTLSTYSSNAVIYYAFGTNVPGANTNIGRYSGPVSIANSALVRARSFANGLLPGPVSSKSYVGLAADVLNFNSDLPLMIVHNFGQGEASFTNQYVAVQTFEPVAGRSSLQDLPAQVESGRFHVRGITSSQQPKRPFFLEIQDEFGADKESELLGLPEESDWALYAPYQYDPPMMHNPLAYEMMRDFGRYAPRTRYVELFLKDDSGAPGPITAADYNGVYVLTEKIKRDDHRVAIDSLEPEHLAEPELSGGYLFSIDQARGEYVPDVPVTFGGVFMNWVSPRFTEMANVLRRPQVVYISNYFKGLTNSLGGPQLTNGGYAAYIDTDSWVDYHLHQIVTMNADAFYHSTYFYKPREGKITFGPPWDFDRSQGTENSAWSFNPRVWHTIRPYFNIPPWWSRLFADPDFWQKWIDRYQELREGPLSTNSVFAHIDRFAGQVREAHLRDQARWGVSVRTGLRASGGFSYDFGSTPSYTNEVKFQKFWYANRFDFLDTNFLSRPVFSSPGGWIEPGFAVTILPAAKPGTRLLYTLDGTDPRLPGGALSPLARSNIGPVTITVSSNVCLAARSYNPTHSNGVGGNGPILGSPWSGLNSAGFFITVPPLRITELMYHPEPGGSTNADEEFEYVEVMNVGSQPLDLNHFKLRGGVEFDFPRVQLQAGSAAVVVANENHFVARYGSNAIIAGAYRGRLDNNGERILLLGPCNEPILDFRYEDDWYPITDGFGFSLVIVDANAPVQNWNSRNNWRPSGTLNGSPELVLPPGPTFPAVVINEVLSHTDFPPPFDTVELHNLSDSAVDIGGWFLTDDFRIPKKYRIPPNTPIAGGGFMLFDEAQFNFGNTDGDPFSFSSLGDEVYLFSADPNGNLTGYLHGFDFGPQENGVTFGRHVTGTGEEHLTRQGQSTLGDENVEPGVGPMVISEIMYHPSDLWLGANLIDNPNDEFIELQNVSTSPVSLAHPEFALNTWRLSEAVGYSFPPNTIIPGGGFALVVRFDPRDSALAQRFRVRYSVPFEVPIFGPYSRKLDNSSDPVELRRPDVPRPSGPPDYGLVPYPLVERVHYFDDAPWPLVADGNGASLHRVDGAAYGNDPGNWVAASPSPGKRYWSGTGPVIARQPLDTTAVEYATASLRVEVTGTGRLIYQWRFNGEIIPGATNATLVLTNVQSSQAGPYEVFLSDAVNSLRSQSARLTVLDAVEIVHQPESRIVAAGSNATFTVTATSTTPITYQWRFNGTNLAGERSRSLTLPNITNIHDGAYTVLVADDISSRLSNPASLTVLLRAQMIAPIPPVRITATSNQSVMLGAQTIGTLPMIYRWRRISPSGSGTVLTNIFEIGRTHFATFPLSALSNGTYVYTLILSNAVQTNLNVAATNAFVEVVADADQDGLPDDYEVRYQFGRDDSNDAGLDADGDGLINLQEFLAGTDPRDPASFLRIESIAFTQSAIVQFGAASNRTYTVQYNDGIASLWNKLTDILPQPANRIEIVLDPVAGTNRYYRLVTPRQP